MVRKRRKGGGGGSGLFCGCFGATDEPPEIELDTTTDHLMSHPMTEATLPMPPPAELQAKFAELVVSDQLIINNLTPCNCCLKREYDVDFILCTREMFQKHQCPL